MARTGGALVASPVPPLSDYKSQKSVFCEARVAPLDTWQTISPGRGMPVAAPGAIVSS